MELRWKRLDGQSGHDAAYELLQQLYGGPLPEIYITTRGKPHFYGQDLHFSITHTKNHAFCCLHSKNVGIDAEECDRPMDLALAEKILSPAEKQRFDDAPDKREALLRLWVLKESYAKLTGRGWGNYLRQTDFDPFDPRIQTIDGCYVAVLEDK